MRHKNSKDEIVDILNFIYGKEMDIDHVSPAMAADLALAVMKGRCDGSYESAVKFLESKSYDLNY